MIFQFSDGEFSDPIATSLKMWKKKISFTHSSLAPPLENLLRGPCLRPIPLIPPPNFALFETTDTFFHVHSKVLIKNNNIFYLQWVLLASLSSCLLHYRSRQLRLFFSLFYRQTKNVIRTL